MEQRTLKRAVSLDGSALDFDMLAQIGANRVTVVASEDGLSRCRAGREVFEAMLRAGLPVYGATTGVGAMKDRILTSDELEAFNEGLVRAHHFGTGDAFSPDVVRSAIAIRINTALTGRVGCTPALIEAYVGLLAADVVPIVRRTGSIGCADIGLMGQIGAVLTGVGEAMYRGRRMPAAAALGAAGLRPLRMVAKDSLASVSVNAVGYAAAAHALRNGAAAMRMLLASGLATASAMGASVDPWRAAEDVGTAHEAMVGSWLTTAYGEAHLPNATHVQDPLSLRMMPQISAIVFGSLLSAGQTVLAAIARPDDNPILVGDRLITSGASLPLDVTLAMQTASLAFAHAARNSFNRCVLIGNGVRRNLPINLVPPGVIATGFGPVIKLAGELFARVLSMCQPISAQSIVVAGGLEDEAAFLPLIVERFERQVETAWRLAALETLLAAQAIDISGDRPGGVVEMIYGIARHHSPFYAKDRPLSAEVEAIEEALASPATLEALLVIAPMNGVDDFFALSRVLTA